MSQVWETKCILEWEKGDIHAWLKKKGWAEHIGALKVSDGEVLASRKFERLAKAVGDDDAEDVFTAVGRILEKHHDDNRWIEDSDFKRVMRDRGE